MIPVRNPPPPFPRSKLFHNKLTLPVENAELGLRCFGGDKFSQKNLPPRLQVNGLFTSPVQVNRTQQR